MGKHLNAIQDFIKAKYRFESMYSPTVSMKLLIKIPKISQKLYHEIDCEYKRKGSANSWSWSFSGHLNKCLNELRFQCMGTFLLCSSLIFVSSTNSNEVL